jgi:hypothetical protein
MQIRWGETLTLLDSDNKLDSNVNGNTYEINNTRIDWYSTVQECEMQTTTLNSGERMSISITFGTDDSDWGMYIGLPCYIHNEDHLSPIEYDTTTTMCKNILLHMLFTYNEGIVIIISIYLYGEHYMLEKNTINYNMSALLNCPAVHASSNTTYVHRELSDNKDDTNNITNDTIPFSSPFVIAATKLSLSNSISIISCDEPIETIIATDCIGSLDSSTYAEDDINSITFQDGEHHISSHDTVNNNVRTSTSHDQSVRENTTGIVYNHWSNTNETKSWEINRNKEITNGNTMANSDCYLFSRTETIGKARYIMIRIDSYCLFHCIQLAFWVTNTNHRGVTDYFEYGFGWYSYLFATRLFSGNK